MSLLVFGHRNPDTDAICSALAYADFLRRTSRPDAEAACCGTPNQRTEFALRTAGVPHPRIIMDIRPEVEDVCNHEPVVARHDDVFYEVYRRMQKHGIRAIPVLDASDQILGIVKLLDLLELMLAGGVDPVRTREVGSTLEKVNWVIGGTFQHAVDPERSDDFVVTVGAMSAGGFTERLQGISRRSVVGRQWRSTHHSATRTGNGRASDCRNRRIWAFDWIDAVGQGQQRDCD